MPDLPRIPKRLTRLDFLIEVFSFIILLESWTYSVYTYNYLSDTGKLSYSILAPTAWSGKDLVWIFPVLATVTFIGISIISLIPHKFTYKETINRLNVRRIYRKAVRKLRILKLVLVSLFGFGILLFSHYTTGHSHTSNSLVLIFGFVLLVLPATYLLYLVYSKHNKTERY